MGSSGRTVLRSGGGFGTALLLTSASSFLSLIILTRVLSASEWTAIALGQSVGIAGAVLVGWGWDLEGTAEAARAGVQQSFQTAVASVYPKLTIALFACPIMFLAGQGLAESEGTLAGMTAVAGALQGLTCAWMLVGLRLPWMLLVLDCAPRAIGLIGGSILVSFTPAWGFPLALGLAGIVAPAVCLTYLARRSTKPRWGRPNSPLSALAQRRHGILTQAPSLIYLSVPTMVVAHLRPEDVATFVLCDKLQRLGKSGLVPVFQVFQGRVFGIPADSPQLPGLISKAILTFSVLALGLAIGFASFADVAIDLISDGGFQAGAGMILGFAAVTGLSTCSLATGQLGLVAFQRAEHVARSAILGAFFATLTVFPSTNLYGGVGAIWSVAVAELVVLVYQAAVLRRRGAKMVAG